MKSIKNKLIPVLGLSGVLLLSGCSEDLGATLEQAGLNTIMGVVIVFLMLLFISAIIGLFKNISIIEKKQAEKKASKNAPAPAPAAPAVQAPVVEEDVTDDLELVAVISAAIAASEGTSPDGLVVRSIRKVSSQNKWKRG